LRKAGLKLRTPNRVRIAFIWLIVRVRSLTVLHARDADAWHPGSDSVEEILVGIIERKSD